MVLNFHHILFKFATLQKIGANKVIYKCSRWKKNLQIFSWDYKDRAERHDLKSLLWLFFSLFLFPPKKEGRKKGE